MTKGERDRLAVLICLYVARGSNDFWVGDECYFPFSAIMRRTGMDRPSVRHACRVLERRGHTAFKAGLWTDEGEPAGAGYRITDAGVAVLGPHVIAAIEDASE